MWKLGEEAIFDCDPRFKNYTIPPIYASQQLIAKYPTWKMIDKKRVVVYQLINTTLNTVRVYLKDEGQQFNFLIDGQWLQRTAPVASGSCTCSTQTLMIRGCVCGHFKKETKQVSLEASPWS